MPNLINIFKVPFTIALKIQAKTISFYTEIREDPHDSG